MDDNWGYPYFRKLPFVSLDRRFWTIRKSVPGFDQKCKPLIRRCYKSWTNHMIRQWLVISVSCCLFKGYSNQTLSRFFQMRTATIMLPNHVPRNWRSLKQLPQVSYNVHLHSTISPFPTKKNMAVAFTFAAGRFMTSMAKYWNIVSIVKPMLTLVTWTPMT
jgi:hypothetical protein